MGCSVAQSSVACFPIRGLDRTKRIKSILVQLTAVPGANVSYELVYTGVGGFITFAGVATATTNALQTATVTIAAPANTVGTDPMVPWLRVTTGFGAVAIVAWFTITYDAAP